MSSSNSKIGKKRITSLKHVLNSKLCYCGKKFNDDENRTNIEKHFKACNECDQTRADIRGFFTSKKLKLTDSHQASSSRETDSEVQQSLEEASVGDSVANDSVEEAFEIICSLLMVFCHIWSSSY